MLKHDVARVERFIEARSKAWEKVGYLQRQLADGVLEVTFAKELVEWISPSYEGKMNLPKNLTSAPSQSERSVQVDKTN